MRRGMLIVLSGPSVVGKGTLGQKLLDSDSQVTFSVSATTRPRRQGEINGVHYHFISQAAFEQLVKEDAFLEHAEVHGNSYGTLRANVEEARLNGRDLLLDIDVQGALSVIERDPDAVTVFVQPPSFEVLGARLRARGSESEETLRRRLEDAHEEMTHVGQFQYTLINDDLEKAFADLHSIVKAERLRTVRQIPDRT